MAAIGYLFVLCFVPLFMAKESKFAQFHGKQGLVLCIAWVIAMMFNVIPFIGWLFSAMLNLLLFIVAVAGFVMAIQGKWYRMPVIADLADKIKL